MSEHRTRKDRGQMEVVGFLVVFAIVAISIALLGLTGFGGLNDVREHEKTVNAVHAFEILDDNLEDLVSGTAPYRATEVTLSDSQITLGDPVLIEVRGYRDGTEVFNYSKENATDLRPIEYRVSDETTLVYMSGAVIREDRGDAVMLEEPSLVFTDESVNIPIVQTRPTWGHSSVGGSRSVSLRTELANARPLVVEPDATQMPLSVTSPYPAVWERYFASLDSASVVRDGDTVTATVHSEDRIRVYINVLQVDVLLE